MATVIIASDAFAPLVRMQAKARGVTPRLVVVKHPIGGIKPEELQKRIDTAFEGLRAEIRKGST